MEQKPAQETNITYVVPRYDGTTEIVRVTIDRVLPDDDRARFEEELQMAFADLYDSDEIALLADWQAREPEAEAFSEQPGAHVHG